MSASAYDAIAGQDLPKHGHVIYGSDYNGSSPLGYPFKVNSSTGSLYVELVGSSSGGTQYIESEALGALPTGTLSMARVTGTLSTIAAIEDDAASLRVSTRGALWTTIDGTVAATQSGTWTIGNAAGASAVNIQDGGNSLTVDGTVAATQSGTWNIATVTTVTTVTSLTQFNGVAIALNTGTRSTGTLRVTIATDDIVPVSQSGTWNIATVTTVTTVSTVTSLTQMNGAAIAMGTGVRTSGTQRVTIATDDVVPASQSGTWNIATVTTVSTVTSLTQFNGVAIALNTGVRTTGTLRVTIATDDIVPASQSGTWNIATVTTVTTVSTVTSLTQMNGAAIAMGTGVRTAGTQRVTIATDDIVPASQSGTWNIATVTTVTTVSTVTSLTQMNGAAIAMGTGVRSAGTQRVTIATDDVVPASQSGTWNIATVTTVTTVSTVTSLTQMNGAAIAMGTGVRSAGTQRVTIATDDVVPASQSGTWNIATVTTVTTVSTVTSLTQFNGVAIALNTGVRSTGTLRVTIATDDVVPASQSGTWNIATVTTVTTVTTLTGGGVASGSADSGNPVKVGSKIVASPKAMTLLVDANRSNLISDTDGAVLTKGWTTGGDRISERVTNTDGASTAFTNFSAVASTFNNITDVTIHNAHATTNGYVDLRDGTAGSVLWTFPAPATGGVTHHFDPPLKQTTANTALAYDVSAAISTVYISVNGFQSKV